MEDIATLSNIKDINVMRSIYHTCIAGNPTKVLKSLIETDSPCFPIYTKQTDDLIQLKFRVWRELVLIENQINAIQLPLDQ